MKFYAYFSLRILILVFYIFCHYFCLNLHKFIIFCIFI
ncbi:hypothetical protein HMPREF1139_0452 [Campylobacter sp. FOBRC14]|nr:hypothetical protein HMPREF1139_0452 [Campylobacter sp. FOBRC14]